MLSGLDAGHKARIKIEETALKTIVDGILPYASEEYGKAVNILTRLNHHDDILLLEQLLNSKKYAAMCACAFILANTDLRFIKENRSNVVTLLMRLAEVNSETINLELMEIWLYVAENHTHWAWLFSMLESNRSFEKIKSASVIRHIGDSILDKLENDFDYSLRYLKRNVTVDEKWANDILVSDTTTAKKLIALISQEVHGKDLKYLFDLANKSNDYFLTEYVGVFAKPQQ